MNPLQVINAYVVISIVETYSTAFLNTFEARLLTSDNLGREECMRYRKRIAELCNMRHLVRNTQLMLNFMCRNSNN